MKSTLGCEIWMLPDSCDGELLERHLLDPLLEPGGVVLGHPNFQQTGKKFDLTSGLGPML